MAPSLGTTVLEINIASLHGRGKRIGPNHTFPIWVRIQGGPGAGPLAHDVGFLTLGPKLAPPLGPPAHFARRPKLPPPSTPDRFTWQGKVHVFPW